MCSLLRGEITSWATIASNVAALDNQWHEVDPGTSTYIYIERCLVSSSEIGTHVKVGENGDFAKRARESFETLPPLSTWGVKGAGTRAP